MKARWGSPKPIGSVCEIIAGQSPKSSAYNSTGEGLPFYQGKKDFGDRYIKPPQKWTTQITKEAVKGDILMSVRAPVGPINEATQPICIGRGLAAIRNSEQISKDYLWYGLLWLQPEIVGHEGAVFASINKKGIEALELPIPPLEEQKRIVAVLDAAFEGLDRARAHTEANLQNARDLFASGLDAAFNLKSGDWEMRNFGNTECLNIIDGDRGKNYPKKADFHSEGHCLFLNTKNVRPNGFCFDSCQFIDEQRDSLLRKGKLEPRDVLLTTRGTIGNIAVFDNTVPFENIRINSGMIILRPNEEKLLAEYLFEVLRSGFVKNQIELKTSGAAQPQLPIKTLVTIDFPAPKSIDEQSQLVKRMKKLSIKTDKLVHTYQAKLKDLSDLRQSLLQKAFAGELT